jgi:hypothetical protein
MNYPIPLNKPFRFDVHPGLLLFDDTPVYTIAAVNAWNPARIPLSERNTNAVFIHRDSNTLENIPTYRTATNPGHNLYKKANPAAY